MIGVIFSLNELLVSHPAHARHAREVIKSSPEIATQNDFQDYLRSLLVSPSAMAKQDLESDRSLYNREICGTAVSAILKIRAKNRRARPQITHELRKFGNPNTVVWPNNEHIGTESVK